MVLACRLSVERRIAPGDAGAALSKKKHADPKTLISSERAVEMCAEKTSGALVGKDVYINLTNARIALCQYVWQRSGNVISHADIINIL